MNIKDYGLKEEKITGKVNGIPARIITTYRDRYEIVSDKGKGFARLKKGSFYDNPNAIYPTIGDFVMIEWNSMGDSQIIETLKRDSSFSRASSSADRNHEMHTQHEQLVAANFDYVFIMQSLNDNFNIRKNYLDVVNQKNGAEAYLFRQNDILFLNAHGGNNGKILYNKKFIEPKELLNRIILDEQIHLTILQQFPVRVQLFL